VSSFLSQLHTVGQIDSDQWVNFLILAIMAVLWLFGTALKAATKKKPSEGQKGGLAQAQRETWQVRLARKAEELQRALEGQSTETGERIRRRVEQRVGIQKRGEEPALGKIAVRSGRGGESVRVYERAGDSTREQHAARQREAKEAVAAAGRKAMMSPVEPKLETIEPAPKPAAEEPADPTLHLPEPLEPGKGALETRRDAVAGYEPASIIDSSDPDALKKAILHYEILGKPLGLRDPVEQSTTF
jgi:hypothetical protein